MSIFNDNLKTIYPDITRVALHWMKYNKHDAEDLVQKAILRALEKESLFKGGNLSGWVVTIMQNIFRDDLRKAKGKIFVPMTDGNLSIHVMDGSEYEIPIDLSNDDGYNELDESEAHLEAKLKLKSAKDVLNNLGGKCKEILLLIAEEYKYDEISKRLEIPMGTVTNRLSRCRKQLHQDLYGLSEYNEI